MLRFVPFLAISALFVLCLLGLESVRWLRAGAEILGVLVLLGLYDFFQRRHTSWRNFPILAHIRWMAEELRPFFRF